MPICQKCQCQFPNRVEIEGKIRTLNKRKFCIVCSPFNNHNTSNNPSAIIGFKHCGHCKELLPKTNFYIRADGSPMSYCISCNKSLSSNRQQKFKNQCVEYKGGQCSICGYSKCIAALEFHHCNPEEKHFGINMVKRHAFNETVKKELDNCILICANCHREIHYDKTGHSGIEPDPLV